MAYHMKWSQGLGVVPAHSLLLVVSRAPQERVSLYLCFTDVPLSHSAQTSASQWSCLLTKMFSIGGMQPQSSWQHSNWHMA